MAAPAGVPFSYAQAAKSKPSQSNTASASASPSQQPKKDVPLAAPEEPSNAANSSSATNLSQTPQSLTPSIDAKPLELDSSSTSINHSQSTSVPITSDSSTAVNQSPSLAAESVPASVSAAFASSAATVVKPKTETKTSEPGTPAENAWESKSQTSNATPSSPDASEDAEVTKEKGKEPKKESETLKTLKEAPPPPVNIWAQRAQDAAKAKQQQQQQIAALPVTTQPKSTAPLNKSMPQPPRENASNSDSTAASSCHLNGKPQQQQQPPPGPGANRREHMAIRTGGLKDTETTGPSTAGPQSTNTSTSRQFSKPDVAGPKSAPLAPVRDNSSWPTPETAQGEDRRKAQEKGEKPDRENGTATSHKPHGRNEWVHVPFTPSVKFNTPLPQTSRRGGRGGSRGDRGGPRDGGPRRGSVTDRSMLGGDAATQVEPDATPRGRKASTAGVALNQQGRSRRPASASQASSRGDSRYEHGDFKRPSLPDGAAAAANGDNMASATSNQRTGRSGGSERPFNRRNIPAAGPTKSEEPSNTTSKLPESATNTPANRSFSGSYRHDAVPDGISSARMQGVKPPPLHHQNPDIASMPDATAGDGQAKSRATADAGSMYNSKTGSFDPKGELSLSRMNSEGPRDQQGGVAQGPGRERADGGRFERGSSRGKNSRGGHPSSAHHHGGQNQANSPFPAIQTTSTHLTRSPSLQSPYMNNSNFGNNHRGYRNGPRSASIPTEAYGRYPTVGYPPGPQFVPYNQYPNPMYDYNGELVPVPYQYGLYYDPQQTIVDVATQLEYYFSLDNLLKDMYLRKHMDSQGFVALTIVANFQRMRTLTTDVELIKHASTQTPNVKLELRMGNDGKERIRRRDEWDKWVLNMSERDPSAQNEGPSQAEQQVPPINFSNIQAMQGGPPFPQQSPISPSTVFGQMPPVNGMHPGFNGAIFVPFPVSSSGGNQQSASTPPPHQRNSSPQAPQPQPKVYNSNRHSMPVIDRSAIPQFGQHTPPPILPNGSPGKGSSIQGSTAAHATSDEPDSFPDEQVESLTVVVRPVESSSNSITKASSPHHFEASRTFSNGSIDSRTLKDTGRNSHNTEEREPRSLARQPQESKQQPSTSNGSIESSDSNRGGATSRSHPLQQPLQFLSPPNSSSKLFSTSSRSSSLHLHHQHSRELSSSPTASPSLLAQNNNDLGMFWIKEKDSLSPLPRGSDHEPYLTLRAKALEQRRMATPGHCPYDLDVLYQFWSHFLIRNFNTNMYNEFRRLAHEDFYSRSNVGMTNLMKYYGEALASQHQIIRDRIARHYVGLVKLELLPVASKEADSNDDNDDNNNDSNDNNNNNRDNSVEAGEYDTKEEQGNQMFFRRLAFNQLRSQWRNGALNMKNRKRIANHVDHDLKAQLDG